MNARSLIVATAGHVDHGKTSLVSRITGTDTDTLEEEKTRGLTINLGFAYHQFETQIDNKTQACTLGFVDVPGHIDFISNMLAGVGNVDFALLVIAADDGIMPQTREHLEIIKLLGICQGAVALTKIDRVPPERVEQIQLDIHDILANSELASAPIFPLSNQSGAGVSDLVTHLQQALVSKKIDQHSIGNKHFRFLVDRSFSVKGIGTVVTGSVRSGTSTKGSELINSHDGTPVRLRGMRLHQDDIETINTGHRAALNIDSDLDSVARGNWLVSKENYQPVSRFDASVSLIDKNYKLRPGTEYHLYLGASHHIVNLRYLEADKQDFIQIKSSESIIAHQGDRFIIRDPAAEHTIGGGEIIDIFVPRKKRSSTARIQTLEACSKNDLQALAQLTEISEDGANLSNFRINRNLTQDFVTELSTNLENESVAKILSIKSNNTQVLLHEKFFEKYRARILNDINSFHTQNPSQQGISEPALSRSVNFSSSHLLFNALLQSLIDDDKVKRTGTLLHLPAHQSSLSKEEEEFLAKVRPILLKAGNVPPRTRELVELTGIPLKPLERILRVTTKAGSLIKVADNRHYLPETIMVLAEFTEKVAHSSELSEGFSVIQFRDESGIGRNLCIEILEYFDRVGFTRRDGNTRFLRTEKENVFGI